MKKYSLIFLVMFLLLIAGSLWNLSTGSVNISISELFHIILNKASGQTFHKVIWTIRMPRLFAAIILGGALSVSGFLLQTFFGNPIAGPFVLGISSGAKLLIAVTLIFFLDRGINLSALGLVFAAFLGSLLSMSIVLLLSFRLKNMSALVVCGILIGYICSAITDFLVTFASDANIVNLHNWSMGSFSGTNWKDILIMSFIVFTSLIFCFLLSKPIGALQLGENYARSLGVNISFLRVSLILLSSLLSACVTAFAGPISFVGIAVPHLVKSIFSSSKPLVLIPACFLGGAIITLLCDGIARTVFAPTELTISTVTAFFLVPVVIYMMLKKHSGRNER